MKPRRLFITGCLRSGTTLVDKLLHAYPGLSVASEPLPELYHLGKRRFLDHRGLHRRYPLGHLFLEEDYTPYDLSTFLELHSFTPDEVSHLNTMLAGTLPLDIGRPRPSGGSPLSPGSFLHLFSQLHSRVDEALPKLGRSWVGSKEVLCEEYAPFLLARDVRVVLVLRDPRDMVASLSFPQREHSCGARRPLLFCVRLWRKSAAFALGLSEHEGFQAIRFEDLVTSTAPTLDRITGPMGLKPETPGAPVSELVGQDDEGWGGNSSFADLEGVSQEPVGRFRDVLPRHVTEFIETACWPEMQAFGYEPEVVSACEPERLRRYRDPADSAHRLFEPGYSSDPERVAAEIERLVKLSAPEPSLGTSELHTWFILPRAFEALRQTRSRPQAPIPPGFRAPVAE